jgi:hypothetical protein
VYTEACEPTVHGQAREGARPHALRPGPCTGSSNFPVLAKRSRLWVWVVCSQYASFFSWLVKGPSDAG